MVPDVKASKDVKVAALIAVSESVVASFPRPEIPAELMAVSTFANVPLKDETVLTSITPEVFVSSVFRLATSTEVSDSVSASSPRPLNPEALYIVVRSAKAPLTDKMVAMLTVPVVPSFTAFKSVAVVLVPLSVTASLPKPVMPLDPVDCRAVLTSAAEPVSNVMLVAVICPVVFASTPFRSLAATADPVSVMASFPRPLIPVELSTVLTIAAVPVSVVVLVA